MKISKYVSILFIICNISVFGQSYSGPATGSVSSGVQVSTNNFPSAPIGNDDLKDKREIPLMKYESQNEYYDTEGEVFDNYTYVEDKNTHSKNFGDIGTSFELHSFSSIGQAGSVPGDPHMAVGPNHVVTTANSQFHIYDREGNLLKAINADAWCSAVVGFPGAFDPQIIYDHYEGRWFMLWDSQNNGNLTGWFIISYSDDEDPIGTWYMYALDATLNGTIEANNWGDYPQLGYDDQGIYISSRQFSFAGSFAYSKIRILNKSELYAANTGPLSWIDLWNIRLPNGQNQDDLHPTISYDPGNNTAYFFWVTDSWNEALNYYVLYKITDPISSPVLTGVSLPVPTYYAAPHGQQLGTAELIDAGAFGSGMRNAPIIRDGKIYGVHHIRNTQFPANASIKYFVVDISSNSVLEQVEYGAQGFWYLYPAITVDKDHNIAITYSRTAATEYVGAFYSTRLSTDPPGFSDSKVMQAGSGSITFNRWGDYLSAALDPINQYDIWLYSEYANMTSWGTWVTEVRMKPFTGIYTYLSTDSLAFRNVEVNTVSDTLEVVVTNYGTDDLVIESVASEVGPFTRIPDQNFPQTLQTYDSLTIRVIFSPTEVDDYDEILSITCNDPGFTEIKLTGHSYEIMVPYTDIFYASTGGGNNGDMITIDRATGVGTTLGPSFYGEIRSLAVHPTNNVLYGLVAGGSNSEIVRVNADKGDAYTLFKLDIAVLTGIDFYASGTLYASDRSGKIFQIDLTNENYTLVTTASIPLNSIAINPTTNQVWGSIYRTFGPGKDSLFTIDLTTGEATPIGKTGFSVMTNDMAFDEDNKLYGVTGASNQEGKLFEVNQVDGTGISIGTGVGYNHTVGLAFSINGPITSVDYEDSIIPDDYALKQNYPNPFNPTTKIEFSLPVAADVELMVYNILGQQVASLINEQRSAGNHSILWNANDSNGMKLSSGIYLYKLKAIGNDGSEFQETKKMVMIK